MTETSSQAAFTDIAIPGVAPSYAGKVRQLYDLDDRMLIVATDRISAYDAILPTGIPGKGRVLTEISAFWFEQLPAIGEHHLISTRVEDFPAPFSQHGDQLAGRSMLVHKTRRIDFECVVRGYLAGSGWREYQATGEVCGIPLPVGLTESARLDQPIFTPATKAQEGHDENIPFDTMAAVLGDALAGELRLRSIEIYEAARRHAEQRGILIADTKFEFGLRGDHLLVIDEVLTPDSSRFWPADEYEPGRAQVAFDKQLVRDHLDRSGWDHTPPAPALPPQVVELTCKRYEEALTLLMGPPRA